jgi:uncharacterized repeat protein (TIGR01451 family)
MGNGRAHRSTLSSDCSTIGFATEASNLVPGDTNNIRDLFVGRISVPADLTASAVSESGSSEPGGQISYTFTFHNLGTETAAATFTSPIPANTTYVSGSVTGSGAVYKAGQNRVEWSGNIPGGATVTVSYAVTISASLTNFTLIINQALLQASGHDYGLRSTTAVNGFKILLPVVSHE